MFRAPIRRTVAIGLASILAATAVPAEDSRPPHPCAAVTDAGQRLACYDAAFAPPADDAAHKEDLRAEPAAPEAEPEPEIDRFGLNPALRQKREAAKPREEAPDSIEALVVGLARRPTGTQVITLDNGQVWVQTEPDNRGRLSAGDQVVIRKAALGSFLLVTESRGSMRVRRIE
jgi:hypothetical protein